MIASLTVAKTYAEIDGSTHRSYLTLLCLETNPLGPSGDGHRNALGILFRRRSLTMAWPKQGQNWLGVWEYLWHE